MMDMDPNAEMLGPPPPLPGEPMGEMPPEMGMLPEALDPDAAMEMMVAGTEGVLADYLKKRQQLAMINELSASAVMGQSLETMDGPAGMEGMPMEPPMDPSMMDPNMPPPGEEPMLPPMPPGPGY